MNMIGENVYLYIQQLKEHNKVDIMQLKKKGGTWQEQLMM